MLSGLLPWYGAKRSKALKDPILAEIGRPDILVVPFCGSCAVELAVRAPVTVTNDLHGDLVNLAKILQDPDGARDLYQWCVRSLVCEAMAQECYELLRDAEDPALRAKAYLYVCWTALNGYAGTDKEPTFNVRWDTGGGSAAKRWQSVGDSIPIWHTLMRDWTITNRDAFDVIASAKDDPGTVLYVDPPYHADTRSGLRYTHEFDPGGLFSEDDHERLSTALARFEHARVVISYYDCAPIRRLYPSSRWRIVENKQKKSLANSNSGDAEAPEIIICGRR